MGSTIHGDDFKHLTLKLQVHVAIRGGVHNAPELALARVNADRRTNLSVHSENSIWFYLVASARRSLRFDATQEGRGIASVFDGLATYDEHCFA